jgi:hypothetical protein
VERWGTARAGARVRRPLAGKSKRDKRGERRKRKRARETAAWGSYPLTRAAAVIRRVDGQGVDSELLPWTEEEDEAVEVGLGLFWASVWKGEGESWARLGPEQRREFFFL